MCDNVRPKRHVLQQGPLRQAHVKERQWLVDDTRLDRPPQARGPVEGAAHDGHDQGDQDGHEPDSGEDAEETQRVEQVDHRAPDLDAKDLVGVPALVHVGDLARVARRIAQHRRRELAHQRSDEPRDHDGDDEDDREPDTGEGRPCGPSQAVEHVEDGRVASRAGESCGSDVRTPGGSCRRSDRDRGARRRNRGRERRRHCCRDRGRQCRREVG